MKKIALSLSFLLTAPAAASEPPFCAVTGMGAQCIYYSLEACQQSLVGLDGRCAVNPGVVAASPSPVSITQPAPVYVQPAQQPNIAGSFFAGAASGQQARQQRAAPIADPWEQVNQNLEQTCKLCASKVTYICEDASGAAVISKSPHIGCVVAEVKP